MLIDAILSVQYIARQYRSEKMIALKQRGRAGLQLLGSLQYFSSTQLRDTHALECMK